MTKKIITFSLCFFWFVSLANAALASFGVSPAYIKSDIVRPGTEYKQEVSILRSLAEEDLIARVEIEAPEIKPWISIDKGFTFLLPKGERRVPMVIRVKVPKGADLGKYSGQIAVSALPAKDATAGIAVSLGALIDFDLTVTNEIFSDFKIRQVKIPDFEERAWPWNHRVFSGLFRRLHIVMRIENAGNLEAAPSKIDLAVYGIPAKEILESMATNKIKKIKAYETEEIMASFPTEIEAGQYWGRIKIYQDNKVLYNDQVAFTIAAAGTLSGYSSGLKGWPWLIISAIGLLAVFIVFIMVKFKIWRYLIKFLTIIKVGQVIKRLKAVWLENKFKFWHWLRRRSRYKIFSTINKNKNKPQGGQ